MILLYCGNRRGIIVLWYYCTGTFKITSILSNLLTLSNQICLSLSLMAELCVSYMYRLVVCEFNIVETVFFIINI